MDCTTVHHFFEDYLDGMLDDETRDKVQAHLQACPECASRLESEQGLREALRSLPAPPPDSAFRERAFARATAVRRHDLWFRTSAMKIAASILLIFALGFLGVWHFDQPSTPEALVRLNQPEDVSLVFNSGQALKNVTLSIETPAGIELAGFGDQRHMVWQTDLAQGSNLLVLPIIARDRGGGFVIAEIRHGGSVKKFKLQVIVQQPGHRNTDRSGIKRPDTPGLFNEYQILSRGIL